MYSGTSIRDDHNWTYSSNFVLCLSGDYILLLFITLPIYINCWYVISHTHMHVIILRKYLGEQPLNLTDADNNSNLQEMELDNLPASESQLVQVSSVFNFAATSH